MVKESIVSCFKNLLSFFNTNQAIKRMAHNGRASATQSSATVQLLMVVSSRIPNATSDSVSEISVSIRLSHFDRSSSERPSMSPTTAHYVDLAQM